MNDPPVNKTITQVMEWFRALVAPILLFSLGVFLIFNDAITHPPADFEGNSGLALVLIAISTGIGLDLIDRRGGK